MRRARLLTPAAGGAYYARENFSIRERAPHLADRRVPRAPGPLAQSAPPQQARHLVLPLAGTTRAGRGDSAWSRPGPSATRDGRALGGKSPCRPLEVRRARTIVPILEHASRIGRDVAGHPARTYQHNRAPRNVGKSLG